MSPRLLDVRPFALILFYIIWRIDVQKEDVAHLNEIYCNHQRVFLHFLLNSISFCFNYYLISPKIIHENEFEKWVKTLGMVENWKSHENHVHHFHTPFFAAFSQFGRNFWWNRQNPIFKLKIWFLHSTVFLNSLLF